MATNFHAIAQEALAFEPADRLRLAAELIDSVDGPADPAWNAAWAEELGRRSAAADERESRGESRGSDWPDARRRLLDDLARR